jgi:hypothetical protein
MPPTQAWAWQKQQVELLAAAAGQPGSPPGRVLLLQHPPVYTLGAGATPQHLRFAAEDPPHPLYRVERGGEVTYHGPGQVSSRVEFTEPLLAAAAGGVSNVGIISNSATTQNTSNPHCQHQHHQAPAGGMAHQLTSNAGSTVPSS